MEQRETVESIDRPPNDADSPGIWRWWPPAWSIRRWALILVLLGVVYVGLRWLASLIDETVDLRVHLNVVAGVVAVWAFAGWGLAAARDEYQRQTYPDAPREKPQSIAAWWGETKRRRRALVAILSIAWAVRTGSLLLDHPYHPLIDLVMVFVIPGLSFGMLIVNAPAVSGKPRKDAPLSGRARWLVCLAVLGLVALFSVGIVVGIRAKWSTDWVDRQAVWFALMAGLLLVMLPGWRTAWIRSDAETPAVAATVVDGRR